ncbi:LOW QUALITY PROTEIN: SET domain-containing protein 4 [Pseudochaenichthys georgianus]|uniref:LOW QUALITY PROTEIN: SET domain-containing protein 4 n=1 Tax=Pseudochaenichthys georgianus TaxID=52239 RepID=UPI00146B24E1|nr:LOW QUALITY PROTEIN: SET domain-containing protein 4 [Pseudochaenichthys georgianus]
MEFTFKRETCVNVCVCRPKGCPGCIVMPGHRSGRAARKRRKKQESITQSVSLSHQQQYVRLKTFLHQRGFTSALLQPARFTDTGRGLQALKTIKSGELIISLPESCLLTTSTVLNSYLGPYIKSWRPRISPLLALCVFLVCERHRGEASDWFPYIDVLPKTYTCPAYFSDDVMAVLPTSVQRKALDQREEVRGVHSSHLSLFRSLQPILSQPVEEVLTYEALRWAWCSVNTRSVFMSHPSSDFLFGQDVYALAPFLDLLNHRPDVQVKASFNEVSRCYEIRSVSGTLRYEQAFINYDSHDSQRLMMEYGFVASSNPNSVVYVDTDLLCDVLKADRGLDQKMKFLRENNFISKIFYFNLTVSSEGPGLEAADGSRLMALPQALYAQWKAVLLGQRVCEEREERSARDVKKLCERILQDTHTALEKISLLLQCVCPSLTEQLRVVEALRQEERCILGNCLKAMECSAEQHTPDELLSRQPDDADDNEDAVS